MSNFKFFDQPAIELSKANINDAVNEISLQPNKNQKYEISYTTKFYALGQLMTNVQTNAVWQFKVINNYEDGYLIDIEVLDHRVSNANPAYDQMIEFLKAFNYPTQLLVLKLNKNGAIERVLNQEEVLERWHDVKEEVLKPLGNNEDDKQILIKGEVQYTNTLPSIKETLLYSLLFGAVYGKKAISSDQYIGNVKSVSQLFQTVPVEYRLTETVNEINNGKLKLVHNAALVNSNFLTADLEKMYVKSYKELCGPEFNYHNAYQANYQYDMASGLLDNCQAKFREKANDKLYFESDYHIKRV